MNEPCKMGIKCGYLYPVWLITQKRFYNRVDKIEPCWCQSTSFSSHAMTAQWAPQYSDKDGGYHELRMDLFPPSLTCLHHCWVGTCQPQTSMVQTPCGALPWGTVQSPGVGVIAVLSFHHKGATMRPHWNGPSTDCGSASCVHSHVWLCVGCSFTVSFNLTTLFLTQ